LVPNSKVITLKIMQEGEEDTSGSSGSSEGSQGSEEENGSDSEESESSGNTLITEGGEQSQKQVDPSEFSEEEVTELLDSIDGYSDLDPES